MLVTPQVGTKSIYYWTTEVPMAQNGGGKGWQWDEDSNQKTMPKKWKDLFMAWTNKT